MAIDAMTVATPAGTTRMGRPQAAARREYSTNARSNRISATATNTTGGANHTTPTASAMSTAPLSTRVIARPRYRRRSTQKPQNARKRQMTLDRRILRVLRALRSTVVSLCAERHRRRLDAAVAAVALLVGDDRLEQIAAAEIGPERFGDPDLRVRDLPQQEVADAHLAARADQQIRIGLPCRVEELAEAPLVERLGAHAGRDRATRGVDDLRAPTVVQRDIEAHARVARGPVDADLQLALHVGRQLVGAADHLELDVVLVERAELEPDVPLQQHHQCVDFRARPLPVLHRERVERQHLDADPRPGVDEVADRSHA